MPLCFAGGGLSFSGGSSLLLNLPHGQTIKGAKDSGGVESDTSATDFYGWDSSAADE
jgi:hypothetical protein